MNSECDFVSKERGDARSGYENQALPEDTRELRDGAEAKLESSFPCEHVLIAPTISIFLKRLDFLTDGPGGDKAGLDQVERLVKLSSVDLQYLTDDRTCRGRAVELFTPFDVLRPFAHAQNFEDFAEMIHKRKAIEYTDK